MGMILLTNQSLFLCGWNANHLPFKKFIAGYGLGYKSIEQQDFSRQGLRLICRILKTAYVSIRDFAISDVSVMNKV